MAASNRASLINKVLKVTKKHYKPVAMPKDRTLLENLVFACVAENSTYDVAEKVFQSLSKDYFDWNEVRVSTLAELAEVMKPLNDPEESATRLKRVLQSVFETHYTFDLEPMKKQNIGQSVKTITKYNGSTPYTVAFAVQQGLAGHSIPINTGLLESMRVVGVISDAEAKKYSVPGLERAVPKTKGVEIGTILHQLGVELNRSPYGQTIRKILLEIDPDCKENLPKRPSKKAAEPEPEKKEAKQEAKKDIAKPETKKATKKTTATKKQAKKPAKATSTKKGTTKKKVKKKVVKKKVAKKKVKKTPTKKKTTTKKKVKKKRKPR